MQGLEKKYGADKLAVVLVSIDAGYGDSPERAAARARAMMAKHEVTWTSVVDPQGWNGVVRRFNLHGYGLTLVGPDGGVRGVDLDVKAVDRELGSLFR